jgi:hypothetical protein
MNNALPSAHFPIADHSTVTSQAQICIPLCREAKIVQYCVCEVFLFPRGHGELGQNNAFDI